MERIAELRRRADDAEVTVQCLEGDLADLGDMTPFSNIVLAEAQHVLAISGLFTARELPVPASAWDDSNVPSFDTRLAACEAGVKVIGAGIDISAERPDLNQECVMASITADVARAVVGLWARIT